MGFAATAEVLLKPTSVCPHFVFYISLSVCRTLFCLVHNYSKAFIVNLLCVLIRFLERWQSSLFSGGGFQLQWDTIILIQSQQ